MIIDTHCHIYDTVFSEDFPDVIQRAQDAGVKALLLPNIDLASSELLFRMPTSSLPMVPMIGLHPCSVKINYLEELDALYSLLKSKPSAFCAIGEIGLDLYWDTTFQTQQVDALHKQISWALAFDLPIVFHIRNAFNEVFVELARYEKTALRGAFHCFTGTVAQAKHILENLPGFLFGIGGVISYKNSDLKSVIKTLPLEKILLETDAPYLPPVPHRGKRNEPSFLSYVVDHLVDCYHVGPNEIALQTTHNAHKLFQLKNHGL